MQQPAKTCCVYEGILPAIKSDQSLGLDGGGLDKLAPRRRVLIFVLARRAYRRGRLRTMKVAAAPEDAP